MDKDGDGSISKEEFKKVCKSLTSEQVTAAFNKFDKEGTGKFVKTFTPARAYFITGVNSRVLKSTFLK